MYLPWRVDSDGLTNLQSEKLGTPGREEHGEHLSVLSHCGQVGDTSATGDLQQVTGAQRTDFHRHAGRQTCTEWSAVICTYIPPFSYSGTSEKGTL